MKKISNLYPRLTEFFRGTNSCWFNSTFNVRYCRDKKGSQKSHNGLRDKFQEKSRESYASQSFRKYLEIGQVYETKVRAKL